MATSDDDKSKEAGDERDGDDAPGEDERDEAPGDGPPEEEVEEASGSAPPKDAGAKDAAAPAAKAPKAPPPRAGSARAAGPKPELARSPPTAGLGKSVTLFIVVVGGISLLMLLLGTERGGQGPQAPKWETDQTVDVDITLVSTDKQDLACASGTEIKGLHCGFESQARKWAKGDTEEAKTLKPYSTTNNVNFLAAGVWSEPALAPDKLPATRFAVKCKYKVAGKMPRADVRWHEGEGWNNVSDWYAGSVSDCKLSSVQN